MVSVLSESGCLSLAEEGVRGYRADENDRY